MGRSGYGDEGTGVLSLLTSRAAMFCIAGLMALTLVGAGSWFWGQRTGISREIWEARVSTETLAARIVEANVIGGLIAEDRSAIQTVDRLVSDLDERVVGVTLSSVDGHAVYSKNPALRGTTTPLGETALQALQVDQPSATLVLSGPNGDPMLRVYQAVQPPGGEALLLQADYDYRAVTADGARVWRLFAPVTLGTLLLLGIVWMCIGWLALRRPYKASGSFEAAADDWLAPEPDLATQAFQAPERDPAVAASYVEFQPPVHQPDADGWLGELHGGTPWPAGPFTNPVFEDDVPLPGALRGGAPEPRHSPEPLLPPAALQPEPHKHGNGLRRGNGKPCSLETALSGMLLPLARRGIDTRLDLPSGLRLPSDTEELLLWAAEEAVRNTVAHGQAQTVKVRLDVHEHRIELTVDDDGRGFDPDEVLARPAPTDQIGLRTLTQLAANAGGVLRVHSAPDRGTRLHLDLPAV